MGSLQVRLNKRSRRSVVVRTCAPMSSRRPSTLRHSKQIRQLPSWNCQKPVFSNKSVSRHRLKALNGTSMAPSFFDDINNCARSCTVKLLVDGCGGAMVEDDVIGNAVGETVETVGSGALVGIVTVVRNDGLS